MWVSGRLDSLDEQKQFIVSALLENSSAVKSDLQFAQDNAREQVASFMRTLAQLISGIEATNQDEHIRTRELILESQVSIKYSISEHDV